MGVNVLAPRDQKNTHDHADTNLGPSSIHHTLAGIPTPLVGSLLRMYGLGPDGAAHLDGAAVVPWADIWPAGTYTMKRDAQCTDVTIDAAIILIPNGFRLYCSSTFTNHGSVLMEGASSTGQAFANGCGRDGNSSLAGTGQNGGTGSAGGNGSAGVGDVSLHGGDGGNGGPGTLIGNVDHGGNGGTTDDSVSWNRAAGRPTQLLAILTGFVTGRGANYGLQGGQGGGGGGCTSGGVTGTAGGGGGGGGIILIGARHVVNSGIISVKGGHGGPGALTGGTTGAGGGGGGGGGTLCLFYDDLVSTGTITAQGGAGGAHAGAGGVGLPGGVGNFLVVQLA